jgi:hypothetical protein
MKKILSLVICFILFGSFACGKKGPPVPPSVIIPQPVKDLKGEVVQDGIRLSWTIPGEEKQFSLFKAVVPLTEDPCEDCPVRFTEQRDIDITDSKILQIEGDKVTYWESMEPGKRYTYKIVVISEDGIESKDSNIVSVGDMQNAN